MWRITKRLCESVSKPEESEIRDSDLLMQGSIDQPDHREVSMLRGKKYFVAFMFFVIAITAPGISETQARRAGRGFSDSA